jgi:hypothetical protein
MRGSGSRSLSEYQIQTQIADWLRLQYPSVLFHMDLSGVRLPIGLAVKVKRLNPYRAWPDIFIAEPRGGYRGLFIELKRKYADVYNKRGAIRDIPHIQEQAAVLISLENRGYKAVFGCGFEDTIKIIQKYLI